MTHHEGTRETHIFRPDDLPVIDRGGGARTIPLVTADRGATTYLNGITRFDPGAQIGHHIHNVAESVMVIQGTAIVDIDGERSSLDTYNTTFVPANIPHHFENASDSEPMAIFWTYGSLDSTRTLLESGSHGRIDAEHPTGESGGVHPIREVAAFTIKEGHEALFEESVTTAIPIFQQAEGARNFQLDRSREHPQQYILTVSWDSVEAHVSTFRNSAGFKRWRELIGDHLAANPEMHHVDNVMIGF